MGFSNIEDGIGLFIEDLGSTLLTQSRTKDGITSVEFYAPLKNYQCGLLVDQGWTPLYTTRDTAMEEISLYFRNDPAALAKAQQKYGGTLPFFNDQIGHRAPLLDITQRAILNRALGIVGRGDDAMLFYDFMCDLSKNYEKYGFEEHENGQDLAMEIQEAFGLKVNPISFEVIELFNDDLAALGPNNRNLKNFVQWWENVRSSRPTIQQWQSNPSQFQQFGMFLLSDFTDIDSIRPFMKP